MDLICPQLKENQFAIAAYSSEAALEYAKLSLFRRQIGKPIAQADAQIAEIALSKNAVLATRNIADFCDCNLTLVNPWEN